MLRGIELYRQHPYQRSMPEPEVIWTEGGAALQQFGSKGAPVLLVPSLINRAYILDLMPDNSLVRWLAAQGMRPVVMDWGAPGSDEAGFGLTDYANRLGRALGHLAATTGGPVHLVGYCMGGLLSLAVAQARMGEVARLALLATPWDFHADLGGAGLGMADLLALATAAPSGTAPMPVDAIQGLFASLDPLLALRKFTDFAGQDQTSAGATHFVAVEDWLNDGVPLAAAVARECFQGWYGKNSPMNGQWSVAGRAVDPGSVARSTALFIPHDDRIVPPGSAAALAGLMPDATVYRPQAGHIGMIVGNRARRECWEPLRDFLLSAE